MQKPNKYIVKIFKLLMAIDAFTFATPISPRVKCECELFSNLLFANITATTSSELFLTGTHRVE